MILGNPPSCQPKPVFQAIGEPASSERTMYDVARLALAVAMIIAIVVVMFETMLSITYAQPAILTGRTVFPKSTPDDPGEL